MALVAALLALLSSPAAGHKPPDSVHVTAAVTTDPADGKVYRVDTVSMGNSTSPCSGGSFKTPDPSPLGEHVVAPGVTVSVTGDKTAGYTVEIDDTIDGEARLVDVYLKGAVDHNSWYHFHPSVLSAIPLFTSDREPERADASHMWFCFEIIELADITVQKVVDIGTASAAQWCFNITPNPNDVTLPLCPASEGSTVTFVGLQTGSYTITETMTVAGYTFASGSGSNCTFSGGTATTSVTTGVVPQDASCTFHNASAPPTVMVVKTATPASLPEPGGDFTFTVDVTNTSPTETVTVTSLNDDVYGDLALMSPDCADLIGDILAPNATGTCLFTGNFTGNAGDNEVDTVVVVVTDTDGQTATHSDDAVVGISGVAPTVTVLKTASPLSLPEPGGDVTFTVVVTNTSAEAVTITSLTDSIYDWTAVVGDCDDLVGHTLAAGASATCTFTGNFTGNAGDRETDVVTVVVTDDDNTTATDDDDATVTLTDVAPTVTVVKTASPSSLPAPGGDFAYTVVITNTSGEAVTITSLTDSIYDWTAVVGDCDDLVGDTLAAGASVTCTFTGTFTGTAGDSETDVVTVVVTDNDGTTGTHLDDATVSLGPAPVVAVQVAGVTLTAAPVQPAVELPRTGSREMQPQVLLALGLVLIGVSFRLVTRRRGFHSA